MGSEQDVVKRFISEATGKTISFIGRAADMISISVCSDRWEFGVAIHIMGDADFLFNEKVILSSEDIYKPSKIRGVSSYDIKIRQLFANGCILRRIQIDDQSRLQIGFSNDVELITRFVDSNTKDYENWRIFIPWTTLPHIVCRSNRIEIEPTGESEQEVRDKLKAFLRRRELRISKIIETHVPNYYKSEETLPTILSLAHNAFQFASPMERIGFIRNELRSLFHIEGKKHPNWIEKGEWPMGKNSPMKYIYSRKKNDLKVYVFEDIDTKEQREITQYY